MKENNFIKNVISLLSTQGILLAINFVSSVLMARWLGPNEKGQYTIATTIYSLGVQFGILGLQSAHTYYLAKDKKKLSIIVGNSLAISGIVGVIAGIGLSIIHKVFPSAFKIEDKLLLLACLMIPVQLFWNFQTQILIALNKIKHKNFMEISNAIAILVVALIIFIQDKISAKNVMSCSVLIAVGLLVYSALHLCQQEQIKPKVSFGFFFMALPYGIKAYIACLLMYLVLRIDTFMVNTVLGNIETGIYSLAVNLADMLSIISSTVGVLLFPTAASCSSDKERIEFTAKTLKITLMVLVMCSVTLGVLAPIGIPILYGKDYVATVGPFMILLPGIVAWGVETIIAQFFASINKIEYPICSLFLTLVSNVVLNLCFIKNWGVNGVALASTISYIVALIIQLIFYKIERKKILNV